jgi:hypothetical protein
LRPARHPGDAVPSGGFSSRHGGPQGSWHGMCARAAGSPSDVGPCGAPMEPSVLARSRGPVHVHGTLPMPAPALAPVVGCRGEGSGDAPNGGGDEQRAGHHTPSAAAMQDDPDAHDAAGREHAPSARLVWPLRGVLATACLDRPAGGRAHRAVLGSSALWVSIGGRRAATAGLCGTSAVIVVVLSPGLLSACPPMPRRVEGRRPNATAVRGEARQARAPWRSGSAGAVAPTGPNAMVRPGVARPFDPCQEERGPSSQAP